MKRRLAQLVAFLVVGAVITLAVACGFAWRGMPTSLPTPNGQEIVGTYQPGMQSTQRRTTGAFEAVQAMYFNLGGVSSKRVSASEFRELLPSWSDMRDGQAIYRQGIPRDRVHSLMSYHEVANGWPFLSLHGSCLVEFTPGKTDAVDFLNVRGVKPTLDKEQWGVPGTLYPYAPIWSGLLLNAVLYAVSLWMLCQLVVLLVRLRRRMRLRRGLCPHCAYPIGTSPVCTECGKPLPSSIARSYEPRP